MSRTWSISAQHPYGLVRVCTAWGISRATVHRHRQAANNPQAPCRRPGPVGAMSNADLAKRIRDLLSSLGGNVWQLSWTMADFALLQPLLSCK